MTTTTQSAFRERLLELREEAKRIAYGPSAEDVDRETHLAYHLGMSKGLTDAIAELDRAAEPTP